MESYINNFYTGFVSSPRFIEPKNKPVRYGEYEIYKHNDDEYHIVAGYGLGCVGMTNSLKAAKLRIDTNEPPLAFT